MENTAAFRRHYNDHLHADLMRFERKRRWFVVGIVSLFMLMAVLTYLVLKSGVVALVLFFIIPWIGWWALTRYLIKQYKASFKPLVVQSILQFIDPELRYYQEEYIAKDTFMRSSLFGFLPDVYKGEDYIMGKIGAVSFEMSELELYHPSEFTGRMERLFRGIFFHANFQKNFEGRIIVIPNKGWQRFLPTIKEMTKYGAYELNNLHDEAFNETFLVYADPTVQVGQILTPELVDAIMRYKQKNPKELFISFVNSHFYVAIDEPYDLLEPNVFLANVDFELVKEFYEELLLLTSIVEDFDVTH